MLYKLTFSLAKILTHELKMYQERMGIMHFNTDLEIKSDDPILKMIGIKKYDNAQLNQGTFDYITPLLLSYKHKIITLDKHVSIESTEYLLCAWK